MKSIVKAVVVALGAASALALAQAAGDRAPIDRRVQRLEQAIERLESRLASLESRLGPGERRGMMDGGMMGGGMMGGGMMGGGMMGGSRPNDQWREGR